MWPFHTALYGSRFALQSSDAFAQSIGYPRAPVDDWLVFHVVFGKTVPDVSLNAIANLGYADCRFLAPVYPGDTIAAASEVIGLKENASGESGLVFVRSSGTNAARACSCSEYVRWVMVRKRETGRTETPPVMCRACRPGRRNALLGDACPPDRGRSAYDFVPVRLGGALRRLRGGREDRPCRRHNTWKRRNISLPTRLYQNPARIHFNQ